MRAHPEFMVALGLLGIVPSLLAGSPQQSNPPAVPVTLVSPTATDCFDGPGCLDASFGERGQVRLDPGGTQTYTSRYQKINAMAIQPNGRIVVAGQSRSDSGDHSWVVARLEVNGSVDRSFGDQGLTQINHRPAARDPEAAYAVVIQLDGRILVAGNAGGTSPDFRSAVVRLTSGGQPDVTFGSNGHVLLELGASILGMALQPDGKIVVVGRASWHAPVVRLMPDGTIDRSFGAAGTRLVSSGLADTRFMATAIALLPTGQIAIGGIVSNATQGGIAVCRVTSDGALDTSFGADGRGVSWFPWLINYEVSIAVAADGSIVAAGTGGPLVPASNQLDTDMAFVRFTQSGGIDPRFGTAGQVVLDMHRYPDHVAGVAFQPDGRIVFAGSARTTQGINPNLFVVGRLTTDGTLDATFGTRGITETSLTGHSDQPLALALDAGGRILVAGSANGTGPGSLMTWAVVRYLR